MRHDTNADKDSIVCSEKQRANLKRYETEVRQCLKVDSAESMLNRFENSRESKTCIFNMLTAVEIFYRLFLSV